MTDRDERPEGSQEARGIDNTVGYKKPPKQHQFKKGKSGNPSGRRRRARGRSVIVKRVFFEKRRVEMDGRTRELTMIELVVLALRQEAMNGKARAFKVYESLEGCCGPQKPTTPRAGRLAVPYVESIEQWTALWGPDGEAWNT